jgi:hypothetical protein
MISYRIKVVIYGDKRVNYYIQQGLFGIFWWTLDEGYSESAMCRPTLEKAKEAIAEMLKAKQANKVVSVTYVDYE